MELAEEWNRSGANKDKTVPEPKLQETLQVFFLCFKDKD